jgi:hypothetical protein
MKIGITSNPTPFSDWFELKIKILSSLFRTHPEDLTKLISGGAGLNENILRV